MVWSKYQSRDVWRLAEEQHGVVGRQQLVALGLSKRAIEHRISKGRLHPVRVGVYAVGRPEITRHGRWMAASLSCGPGAVLSHGSAAALWGIGVEPGGWIEISVRASSTRRQKGVRVHRRPGLRSSEATIRAGIPVTTIVCTLIDIALDLDAPRLERAINEADRLSLIDPDTLRSVLETYRGRRGVARLRETLDRRTFRLTDSELERRFLRLVGETGLPIPLTRQHLNGFRVDFFWPELGLVVETDGLIYHRTPAQQARDHVRDQAHTAAGLTPLRFTHAQVRFEPEYVRKTLFAVARRLEQTRAA
jgi:very-short-patch-repair endonuclease